MVSHQRGGVEDSDFATIAVPMERTLGVAKEVAGSPKRGSTLVEISSVKGETLPEIRKLLGKKAAILDPSSFRPRARLPKGMKVAVIVGKGRGTPGL